MARDHFHIIQDLNWRLDEARKIEQDAWKVEIPRKIFLVGKEKLSKNQGKRVLLCEGGIKKYLLAKK